MFALTPKQTSWAMQGATVALTIFMMVSYGHVSWGFTKMLMVAVGVLAAVMFFYTLAHYIAEERWLRKIAREGEIEIDGNAP